MNKIPPLGCQRDRIKVSPGVNVMITILGDFLLSSAGKGAFLKTNAIIFFLPK
jgi:hypothetical protein